MFKVLTGVVVAILFAGCASSQKANSETATAKTASAAPAAQHSANAKAAAAAAEKTETQAGLICTNGKDARTVKNIASKTGCQVMYTKAGKESEVASSSKSDAHCKDVVAKMRGKLEAAGFKCSEK